MFYPENISESYEQESEYSNDHNIGSYMFWFKWNEKKYCVDATEETPYYGRLFNHSRKNPNCAARVFQVVWEYLSVLKIFQMNDPSDPVRLIICAAKEIPAGTALTIDYGDNRKASLEQSCKCSQLYSEVARKEFLETSPLVQLAQLRINFSTLFSSIIHGSSFNIRNYHSLQRIKKRKSERLFAKNPKG